MRHGHGYNRLGIGSSHRKAMLRNLATSLVLHERIATTLARAKELRAVVDRLITLGKRGDLHARRQVCSVVFDDSAMKKLFGPIADRMKTRPGGYTRILHTSPRQGDNAKMALIELVDFDFAKRQKELESARESRLKAEVNE